MYRISFPLSVLFVNLPWSNYLALLLFAWLDSVIRIVLKVLSTMFGSKNNVMQHSFFLTLRKHNHFTFTHLFINCHGANVFLFTQRTESGLLLLSCRCFIILSRRLVIVHSGSPASHVVFWWKVFQTPADLPSRSSPYSFSPWRHQSLASGDFHDAWRWI